MFTYQRFETDFPDYYSEDMREFYLHYKHDFLTPHDGNRTDKDAYDEACQWCFERWGAPGRTESLGRPFARWAIHGVLYHDILIHEDNDAFEFRLRWC